MARTSTRPRRGSSIHLTSAFDLFRPSYDLVKKNIWIFGPLYAVLLVFGIRTWLWAPSGPNAPHHFWGDWQNFGPGWSASPLPFFTSYAVFGFAIVWFLFVLALGTIVQIMAQRAQLDAAEGKHLSFDKLWDTVKEMGWRMLGLYIVVSLVVGVGLILLVVPGVIFMRRYYLAPYVMLDKKPQTIGEAMAISSKMSKAGGIWSVIGVLFLIGLVSIVPIIGWLASFLLAMAYSVAPALRYQELKNLS